MNIITKTYTVNIALMFLIMNVTTQCMLLPKSIKNIKNIPFGRNLYLSRKINTLEPTTPNKPTEYEMTPLHIASQNGAIIKVKSLIRLGANVNQVDEWGYTPLHCASLNGHIDVIKELIEAGADATKKTNYDGDTPVDIALEYGHTKIVDLLQKKSQKSHNLKQSTSNRNHEFTKHISSYIRLYTSSNTRLNIATSRGHVDAVKLLIAAGADVNEVGDYRETPLNIASYKGHVDIVKLLIAAGADVNQIASLWGDTPLQTALDKGHADVVKLLITSGADVNKANKWGDTPLHIATGKGDVDIVVLLIAAGADVNKANKWGNTPLHIASHKDHKDVVKLLIAAGANKSLVFLFFSEADITQFDKAMLSLSISFIAFLSVEALFT